MASTGSSIAFDSGLTILGEATMNESEMLSWWSTTYGGQPANLHTPIAEFIHIVYTEAASEGVRPDVMFAQMIVETGAFTNSDTRISNFAGIGHYDNLSSGRSFATDTIGVRAQAQLLHRVVVGNGLLTVQPDVGVHWGGSGTTDVWNRLGGATAGGVNWASNPNYWSIISSVYDRMLGSAAMTAPSDQVAGRTVGQTASSDACQQVGSFSYLTETPTLDATGTVQVEPAADSPTDTNGVYSLNTITDTQTAVLAARSVPAASSGTSSGESRALVFPVLGPVSYADTWGACRDVNCSRHHEGTDIIGVQMQPVRAAVDGTIGRLAPDPTGISGVGISITDDQGWRYNYFHLNNDTPGTDDGSLPASFGIAPGLHVGDHVRAGQIIGYMGNSGNAEQSVVHLHFEIRDQAGVAHPSYASLVAADKSQSCSIGLGPWSTPNVGSYAAEDPGSAKGLQHVVVSTSTGRGEWTIDSQGRVTATGDAALVAPSTHCDAGPTHPFGTDAAGWSIGVTAASLDRTPLAGADLSPTPLGVVLGEQDNTSNTMTWKDPVTGSTIVVTLSDAYRAAAEDRTSAPS